MTNLCSSPNVVDGDGVTEGVQYKNTRMPFSENNVIEMETNVPLTPDISLPDPNGSCNSGLYTLSKLHVISYLHLYFQSCIFLKIS